MTRFIRTFAVVASVGAVFGLWLTSASAHNGTLSASCDGVTALFANFPSGEHDVTFYIGDAETDSSFNGTSGSVFVPWDFTAGGSYQISVAWSADGGGQAGPISFDATECVPTTTTVPSTTVPPICDQDDPEDCEPPPCYDPQCPPPPTTVPDVCDDGSLPPCVDPDIIVVPPATPAGPVAADPEFTG